MFKYLWLFLFLIKFSYSQDEFLYDTFPPGFKWGVATAAYQIEGAWNTSGKGESIWDYQVHNDPTSIQDNSTGDIACDSYHLYETDVQLIKNLSVHFYRFSLSWSRILPNGDTSVINQDGINYYNNLINSLIQNGLEPLVTLYHWDLPRPLHDLFGGWLNETVADYFEQYADVVFSSFGDRVKYWITLNEPFVQAEEGYGTGRNAPQIISPGVGDYIAAHNQLKAHARAWHLYNDTYRASQQGVVSITNVGNWFEPQENITEDIDTAERAMQFWLGWFTHPVYSQDGDYPAVMKEYVLKHSLEEGYNQSRLPEFGQQWVDYIKGTYDFFGLNHYTTNLVSHRDYNFTLIVPSLASDAEVFPKFDPSWPGSSVPWLKVVPWGFRKLVNWIKNEYGNIPILITENGFADYPETGVNDIDRVNYYRSYINELLKAIKLDGCNVIGYTAWSILDNFEWADGYTARFGIHYVDFEDPFRPRTPKLSAFEYAQIVADNGFPPANATEY